jgi:alpha-tubulin suppressor-like RCC1 family protein
MILRVNKCNIFLSLLIISLSISCLSNKDPFSPDLKGKFEEQLDADVDHAVLKSDGTLWTWGGNWSGQCGNGTLESNPIPQKVKKVKDIVSFKFRNGAAVAADISGNIWYWGECVIYSFSPDIDVTIETPEKISELAGCISMEMRASTIDLLRNDGTIWRLNRNPADPTAFIEPEKVTDLDNIKAISGHFALKNDGTIGLLDEEGIIPGWGGYISGIQDVKALQNVWRTHTVILKTDGTVWAWGRNKSGALGDGTFNDSSVPVQAKNLTDIIAISANGARCLALKNDGTVWFWGLVDLDWDNNIFITQNTPQKIDNLRNVTHIFAAAAVESLVKKSDGTYWMFTFKELIPYQVPFDN